MSVEKASQAQIRMIHSLSRLLALPEEIRRDFLEGLTGKRSCKFLSKDEATRVIDALQTRIEGKPLSSNRSKESDPRYWNQWHAGRGTSGDERATPKQIRLIEGLWADVSRQPDEQSRHHALQRFLMRIVAVERPEWLRRDQVRKVVAALRQMQAACAKS